MPKIYGDLHSPKPALQGLSELRRFIFGSIILLGVLYGALLSGWFSVKNVEVRGALFTKTEQQQAQKIKGSNILFLPKEAIAAEVLSEDSVDSVSITRSFPQKVFITIKEKEPALIWQSAGISSVIDTEGFAIHQFPINTHPDPESMVGKSLLAIPLVIDTKNLPVHSGNLVVTSHFVKFTKEVNTNVASTIPEFETLNIEIGDSTYDSTYISKKGMRVHFSTLGDAGVQVRNLARLLSQGKATLSSIVDLRIDRWAYVQ